MMPIVDTFEQLEGQSLVGRRGEIATFERLLLGRTGIEKIISIHGTGGTGKSTLLAELGRRARAEGCITLSINGLGLHPEPFEIYSSILQLLQDQYYIQRLTAKPTEELCTEALNEMARHDRVVLFIDHYERLEALDDWFRCSWLPGLHENLLVVIAGRRPLAEPWMLSGWRHLIVSMRLTELTAEDVQEYLHRCGYTDRERFEYIWRHSKGHPLMMSLLCALPSSGAGSPQAGSCSDAFAYVVHQWLREVPDEQLVPFIEAACVLSRFNQDSLSFVAGREISAAKFRQLVRCSFVRRRTPGWEVHELMRVAVVRELRDRSPERFAGYMKQALLHYYHKVQRSPKGSVVSWEAGELAYYLGDGIIRALLHSVNPWTRPFVPVGAEALAELEAYVERRWREARPAKLLLQDPFTEEAYRFELTAEQTLATLKGIDFTVLLPLGDDVIRVVRDEQGRIEAFAAVIPIHEGTLSYLRTSPRYQAYFEALSKEEWERLSAPAAAPAGYCIETIDFQDLGGVRDSLGHFFLSLMFSDYLVINSPPPHPLFELPHRSMGFEIAAEGEHTFYDGVTPAPVFVLDRRAGSLESFVQRMLEKIGQQEILLTRPVSTTTVTEAPVLTEREQEVLSLLLEGLTNGQMSERLFLSEVTVKKHLRSLFHKFNVKSRTQLLSRTMGAHDSHRLL
ncbi:LuxR C-terminal-related transcriptional regulator [Paenibacillus sp. GD4]|uniref:LuxR C-terminal-related transcriptional regulator n=1 Tax=Paenibacillus sp. GD4 TaxID=3068890 RepID=UPI002796A910|nr:LuxR C-terminal-related transcriptional regulator [Paenibacillus sp. GD4]MDQ1914626.1 LuxR C-terminal-related transcriptional regulator [Paenibacillus sp. GD4]